MKTFLIVLFITAISFAQAKDSTQFRFWVNELQNTQKQLMRIDTLKIGLQYLAEYQYHNAAIEERKLKVPTEKKEGK